jgi:transposase
VIRVHKIRLHPTPEQASYFRHAAGIARFNHDLKLSDRTWVCTSCRTIHPRDWNASKNIAAEALRLACAYKPGRPVVASSGVIARGWCVRPRFPGNAR